VSSETVLSAARRGFEPAIVQAVSSNQFAVWVRHSPVSPQQLPVLQTAARIAYGLSPEGPLRAFGPLATGESPIHVSTRPYRHAEHLAESLAATRRATDKLADAQLKAISQDSRALQCESVLLLFNSDGVNAVTRAVNALSEMPVRIQLLPIGLLDLMHCSRIGYYGRTRVFEIASGPNCVADRLLKRSFDLVVATMAGLLLLSVMLIVAALIKLDSPGPVLFRQTRHGYNNKHIEVLKLRTMMVSDDREFRQTGGFRQHQEDQRQALRL